MQSVSGGTDHTSGTDNTARNEKKSIYKDRSGNAFLASYTRSNISSEIQYPLLNEFIFTFSGH
jgi:hypothetical protein